MFSPFGRHLAVKFVVDRRVYSVLFKRSQAADRSCDGPVVSLRVVARAIGVTRAYLIELIFLSGVSSNNLHIRLHCTLSLSDLAWKAGPRLSWVTFYQR